jgi:hypothetical protein
MRFRPCVFYEAWNRHPSSNVSIVVFWSASVNVLLSMHLDDFGCLFLQDDDPKQP